MLKYLLDTHIVIYTMKNKPASVKFERVDGLRLENWVF